MSAERSELLTDVMDNKYAWLIVIAPIIGLIFELIAGEDLIWIYFLLNVVFFSLDYKELKGRGLDMPHIAWVILIPVYLWKRANLLGQKKHYFWGWVVVFLLSLALSSGSGQGQIEDSAIPVVSQMLQREYGTNAASCLDVQITDEIFDDLYIADAILDNGEVIQVNIRVDGESFYVTIPDQ